MGGGNLAEGLILAALYPFSGFRADAFVHPHAILRTSSWTHHQERQQQQSCRRETRDGVETQGSGSSGIRRPRQRRELSYCKGLRMQADTTGTETELSDVVPPSLTQFDNRER